jgi:hypothetical protein
MFDGFFYNHMTLGSIIISFRIHEVGGLAILHKKT